MHGHRWRLSRRRLWPSTSRSSSECSSAQASLSDPDTVVGWGGNFGPRTTNGEWWRLVTAMFVHSGPLHLLANIVGLIQIGLITERLFGRGAFATAYLAAGVLASLVSVALHSVGVSAGATASIFGVYGLFLAALIAGNVFHSPLTVPLITALKLVPAAAVFILYSTTAGFDGIAEIAGLAVGCVYGLVLAQEVGARTPSPTRVAATTGVVLLVVIAVAVPLRGLTDVRPVIERVAAVEHETASSYDAAARRFSRGEMSIGELTDLIDRTILPELRAVRDRLKKLEGYRGSSRRWLPPPRSTSRCGTKAGAPVRPGCARPAWVGCARQTTPSEPPSRCWNGSFPEGNSSYGDDGEHGTRSTRRHGGHGLPPVKVIFVSL